MKFYVFGEKSDPAVVLIHGVFNPWQIWGDQIDAFKRDHYVVVPALDAHIEDVESEFESVEAEARQIEEYIRRELDGSIYALCGLSMGGAIAYKVFERQNVKIDHLVLDGAPLVKTSALAEKFMTLSYTKILQTTKKRDKKTLENFKKDFLPEKYLKSYLKFADTMSETSVKNMIRSVCAGGLKPVENAGDTKILYLHGTAANERYSIKTAKALKKYCPGVTVKSFSGYNHAELAVYHPDEWVSTVKDFLSSDRNP